MRLQSVFAYFEEEEKRKYDEMMKEAEIKYDKIKKNNKKIELIVQEFDKLCLNFINSEKFLTNYRSRKFSLYSSLLNKIYDLDDNITIHYTKNYKLDNGDIVETSFSKDFRGKIIFQFNITYKNDIVEIEKPKEKSCVIF